MAGMEGRNTKTQGDIRGWRTVIVFIMVAVFWMCIISAKIYQTMTLNM